MTKLRFTAFLTSYCIYVPKIDEFMFSTHRTHFFRHIIHNHSVLFAKVHKKQYLCKVFRDKNLSGKRECLISCKIAKSLQRIYKARSSSYTWAIRVVYSGVWRYLQENTVGSPLSLTINIVKSPSWLSAENSCKIRHYECILEIIFNRSCVCYTLISPRAFLCRRNVAKRCYCKDDQ